MHFVKIKTMNPQEVLRKQTEFFNSGKTRNVSFRIAMLKKLFSALKENEEMILDALNKDLSKGRVEAYSTELGIVYSELRYHMHHVRKWAKRKRVRTALLHFPSKSYVIKEPVGNTLIMSPWNYPVQLTLVPLIGAISAGCTAVIKPSRYSENVSKALSQVLSVFDESYIALFEGGREMNSTLLALKWDYIFFTGSPNVGKIVAKTAGESLTPYTLELGGKSPVIIDESADIEKACSRIAFGKLINAGQTCIAPDYFLVHKSKVKEFITTLPCYIEKFYSASPLDNPDYPKIINRHHYDRVKGLLDASSVVYGGKYDDEKMKISPTILYPVREDEPVMMEEIFGPVIPVLEYEDLSEAIDMIRNRPRPLALYIFSKKKKTIKRVHSSVIFGGGCVNDVIMHIVSHTLAFGGIGNSGSGAYHGKHSYDTFTHEKSILKHSLFPDITLRNPPYGRLKEKIIRIMLH